MQAMMFPQWLSDYPASDVDEATTWRVCKTLEKLLYPSLIGSTSDEDAEYPQHKSHPSRSPRSGLLPWPCNLLKSAQLFIRQAQQLSSGPRMSIQWLPPRVNTQPKHAGRARQQFLSNIAACFVLIRVQPSNIIWPQVCMPPLSLSWSLVAFYIAHIERMVVLSRSCQTC